MSELLRVEELRKTYPARGAISPGSNGRIPALDGVSFSIAPGETVGLVGESGSGKTTTGRLLLRFEQPDSGRVFFEGEDWLALEGPSLRRRRRDIQIVFQDPQTSLNPRMRVGDQIAEPLRVQKLLAGREQLSARVSLLLANVGLPAEAGERFPSEFSGGQRQRVAIARALATGPKLLVCDEPVSALDVSVAAQIINLLLELQEKTGLSLLFISHDLAVVERLADRVLVLYRGRVVEEGPTAAIVRRPLHPYTAALLSAAPDPNLSLRRSRIVLPSDTAPSGLTAGCAFQPRCPVSRPRCRQETPPLEELEPERRASCFFPGELPARTDEPSGSPLPAPEE